MADSSEHRSLAAADRRATRTRVVLALVVLVTAAVVVVLVQRGDDASASLDHARRLVADDANFATATDAGVTFTRISRHLQNEAEACRSSNAGGVRCDALFSGSAYARVSAVAVLRCTRPGVFDARTSMRSYLDALSASDDADPALPAIVRCG